MKQQQSQPRRIVAARREIASLIGEARPGGSPNSNLHSGQAVALLIRRGLGKYLPDGCHDRGDAVPSFLSYCASPTVNKRTWSARGGSRYSACPDDNGRRGP